LIIPQRYKKDYEENILSRRKSTDQKYWKPGGCLKTKALEEADRELNQASSQLNWRRNRDKA
jgi:hypothetical protein